MSTIIPYFDPILGKLRNSDVALISVASLIVPDPLIVNNLQVLSNASVNQLHTNSIYNVSTISTNGLGLNYAQWNSNTSLGPLEGLMNWSSLYGTIQLGLAGGNVDVPLGLTTNLPKRVRNSTGSTMPKGTAVYLNGVSGNTPLVERALATGDRTSAFTIGMTAEDIANNATGWVTSFGLIRGIDTSSFTSGDTLYLSGATAGYYTNVPTKTPVHYVRVGTVTKASADGEIIVNVINGYELDELHNVIIASLASGQILQSGASSYWYNRSLASAVADLNVLASLGSLAYLNSVTQEYLPSSASFSNLYVTDIQTGGLAVTSTASVRNLRATNIIVSNVTVSGAVNTANIFGLNFLGVASLISTDSLGASNIGSVNISNTSNISTNTLYANIISSGTYLNLPSLGSLAQISDVVSPLNLSGPTLSLSVASISHKVIGDLQGGAFNEYFHLDFSNYNKVTSGVFPVNSPASTNRFITAYNSSTGAFTIARPTWANIDKTTSPINDLSDVTISSALDGQVLTYELSSTSWKNKSIPIQENILENANHINNSTNGYGGISNGWTSSNANPIQGGFPYLEWDSVYGPGATTAFWYLNEASGNAIDGKTGTYPLTDTNTVGASATLGLMDYARSFNGTNQRFSGTVALGNVAGSQTFVAFVRPNVVNVAQHICGYNDGTRSAYLGISATGKAFFNFTGTTPTIVTSDVTLEANKWYLIIGSYDSGGELRIFVNGVYKAVSCTGTHVVTTNNIFQIGATNSANHFNGYINAVAHYYEVGWDEEKMLSLFAVSIYKNTKIYRSDTVSEISLYQLLGREQMHRFNSQTVTFSAEVYQTNLSNAKVTIYNGSANYDSNTALTTGSWETVSVTFTFAAANAEVYFNLRTSSGAVGPIWYRNIKLNYGNSAIGNNIHNTLDWQKFPRLLMLDIPKMFDGKPYQYEENKWYTWTPTTNPTGATGGNTEWKFEGNKCFIKGQLTQTHASATWTHTLPIYTGSGEVIRGRWGKVQNNAGAVGLGNWFQTTVNSSSVNMYSSIANAAWSTTSGAKVFIFDMTEWEID